MSNSLQPHGLQHIMLPCPSLSPRVCSNSCPLSWGCHPTIASSVLPFSPCLQSYPGSGSFPMSQVLISDGPSIEALASASVLPMNIRVDFPWEWLIWSPCCPRDSQESSPAVWFKGIIFSALSLLYGPTLTSIPDYRENHSFDYMDFCWQNNVSAF